jgi:hypothetical protein
MGGNMDEKATNWQMPDGDFIYYIPIGGWEKGKGHKVSIVFENDDGHYPTGGGDKEPWYWGNGVDEAKSYRLAQAAARELNRKHGISAKREAQILGNSMRLGRLHKIERN